MKSVFINVEKRKVQLEPKEDTQYVLELKGNIDCEVEVLLNSQGINVELIGIFNLKENQKINLVTKSVHIVQATTCMTTIKGVLGHNCFSNYIGKIIIKKEAQNTVSYLDNKVLLVGNGINNMSQPILEIEADDVRASHGATTGTITPNEIFYLQSRGLLPDEAKELIVKGFLNSLALKIKDEKIKEQVLKYLYV